MDFLIRLLNPESAGANYIEDLASAYYLSEALFTAHELGLFEAMGEESLTAGEIAGRTGCDEKALLRLLALLQEMRLVGACPQAKDSGLEAALWYLTGLAQTTLLPGGACPQRDNIAWRVALRDDWASLPEAIRAGGRVHFPINPAPEEMDARRARYLRAMDAVLAPKIDEILPILDGFFERANPSPGTGASPAPLQILDLGAGSGLFSVRLLEHLENTGREAQAELFDIPEMEPVCREGVEKLRAPILERITFSPGNLLDSDWALSKDHYDLIILSNIVHAYDAESRALLAQAAGRLAPGGLLLIHDFFLEHDALKSRMSDMNMFVNTYNGRAFTAQEVTGILKDCGLSVSGLTALSGDTALLFAGSQATLDTLRPDACAQLIPRILALGFTRVLPIDPKAVAIGSFARAKCHFGCSSGAGKTCRENDRESLEALTARIGTYRRAFLLLGEPPTDRFQRQALLAEAEAFKSGFHKAFVFWAGPCSICPDCDPLEPCQNPMHHRPSMEGAGIDVFETAKRAGIALRTLRERGEFIRYLALLLLD